MVAYSAACGSGPDKDHSPGFRAGERAGLDAADAMPTSVPASSVRDATRSALTLPRQLSHMPMMPLGRSKVTATNRPPSANSQNSGSTPVNQDLPALTSNAPMIGPTIVPRPPTAAQITTSIELDGSNSPGLMMPTCGT